jgi:hypothetical protein
MYKTLSGKPEEKRSLGRSRILLKLIIKQNHCKDLEWIQHAIQNRAFKNSMA